MPQIPEKLIKFPKIEALKANLGKDISIGLPAKSPVDLEIKAIVEPKQIDIDIGWKLPEASGEINIQGPKIDLKVPNINLKGKSKGFGISIKGKGKTKGGKDNEDDKCILRSILSAPVDDPINLIKKSIIIFIIKISNIY